MHISLNWLKDFVKIPENITPQELGKLITVKTAEVDNVEEQGKGLEGVVIGELIEIKKHPNADRLNLALVDIGKEKPLHLIFGDKVQMKVGNKVPVAVAPTTLPTGITIEAKPMRGEMSEGMLCLDQELGLAKEGVTIHYFPKLKPGTPVKQALELDDTILEFDNKALTHRPDLWGQYGIARDIAAITDSKLKPYKANANFPKSGEKLNVVVKDPMISPRFCACLISDIEIKDSPKWMQKRLLAANCRPINNIVDVTNYVMLEYGQPMHAYDRDIVKTDSLVAEFAPENMEVETIDHKKRKLTSKDMIVSNGKEFLDLAGIMGGASSEISTNTTRVILEAANWNPSLLRQTSVRQGLRSEASQRFEKSQDPEMCPVAITKAAELILKMCPKAKIVSPLIDIITQEKPPVKITLRISRAISKIGVNISKTEIKKILKSLHFTLTQKDKDTFEVLVPTFRGTKDVTIEDDLIEEIARIYGYETIAATLPTLPTKLPIENSERFKKHRLRDLMSYGLGYDEIYNYSFYGQRELADSLINEENHLKLLNYLSADQTHLRTTLVPNVLKAANLNSKNFEEFRLYEIGHTYKEIDRFMPLEEKKMTALIAMKGKTDTPFYEAKGVMETILNRFNIKGIKSVKGVKNAPYAHPVKSLTYLGHKGQTLAQGFILHPVVNKNFDLEKFSIAILDLNFTELLQMEFPVRTYKPIPKFPSINIDVSVLVDRTLEIEKLKEAIAKADQSLPEKLITDIKLFDIYEGEKIETNKKAIAFTITLQTPERTLTDEDMTKVQTNIFKELENLGGVIRGK